MGRRVSLENAKFEVGSQRAVGSKMTVFAAYPMGFIVKPVGQPIFCEMATEVYIDDEAGGPFVVVKQTDSDPQPGQIRVSEEEWPIINEAVEKMLKVCREISKEQP